MSMPLGEGGHEKRAAGGTPFLMLNAVQPHD
jgi:hypothetical protein